MTTPLRPLRPAFWDAQQQVPSTGVAGCDDARTATASAAAAAAAGSVVGVSLLAAPPSPSRRDSGSVAALEAALLTAPAHVGLRALLCALRRSGPSGDGRSGGGGQLLRELFARHVSCATLDALSTRWEEAAAAAGEGHSGGGGGVGDGDSGGGGEGTAAGGAGADDELADGGGRVGSDEDDAVMMMTLRGGEGATLASPLAGGDEAGVGWASERGAGGGGTHSAAPLDAGTFHAFWCALNGPPPANATGPPPAFPAAIHDARERVAAAAMEAVVAELLGAPCVLQQQP